MNVIYWLMVFLLLAGGGWWGYRDSTGRAWGLSWVAILIIAVLIGLKVFPWGALNASGG